MNESFRRFRLPSVPNATARRILSRSTPPVAVVLALGLAGCGGSTTAPPPPSGGATHDLVFEGTLASTPEILLRDPDDGSVRRVLPPGTVALDPRPSPDGTRIAFVVADYDNATGDVFVVNRDGSGRKRLTFAPELDDQPSWSPDGTRIAFRSYRNGREGDIWVMDADGGSPVNLIPDPLPGVWDERAPAWSPDGTRIAYASNAAGNLDLWTMAADGSDQVQLTFTADFDTEPAWSPDGLTIAFRRTDGTGSDVFVIPAGGGSPVRLPLAAEQRLPVWTPDGTRITFVSQPTLTTGRPDIFSMKPDGTDAVPLVTDEVPGGSVRPGYLRRPGA